MLEKERRLWSTVSLARKAGKVVMGSDQVNQSVARGVSCLVLLASDVSEKSVYGLKLFCEKRQVPIQTLSTKMDEIWFVLGKRVGMLSIEDKGFAQNILSLLGENLSQ